MQDKANVIYSVVFSKDKLSCIDTSTGSTKGTLSYNGTIVSGPVVTGDRCVVIFSTPSGNKGKIMKLPFFSTTTTFNA